MLHILGDLEDFSIEAADGKVGRVIDFYFDDRRWVIRYLVVDLDTTSGAYKVLLSPAAIKHLDKNEKTITVDMLLDEVVASPRINTDHALPSHYEIDYLSYYGYAFNWNNSSPYSFSVDDETSALSNDVDAQKPASAEEIFLAIDSVRRMYGDRHLRSYQEMRGYHIQATDDELGHLDTLLIDDDTWEINSCVVNTSQWWSGHQVLITPQAIRDISWGSTKIYVDMTQQQVKSAPLFDYSPTQNATSELGVFLHQEQKYNQGEAAPDTYN